MTQSPVIEKLIHQIDAKHDRQQQISLLISRLIEQHNIQYGEQLRLMLGIAKRCDNFTALEHWVNQNYDFINHGTFEENYQQLENKLLKQIPEHL